LLLGGFALTVPVLRPCRHVHRSRLWIASPPAPSPGTWPGAEVNRYRSVRPELETADDEARAANPPPSSQAPT